MDTQHVESKKNLKQKRRALEVNKTEESKRAKYYKAVRREQKKQRREKKRNGIPQCHVASKAKVQKVAEKPVDKGKEKSLQYLPRGKQMLSAALARAAQEKETPKATGATPKRTIIARDLREIDPDSIVRDKASQSIGSGTFGTCFLGEFRCIKVVIKEYKKRQRGDAKDNNVHLKLQQEAAYEARIIEKLGDHPCIPLLFGVMLNQNPVRIVLQFHGDGAESITLYKAAKKRLVTGNDQWKVIFRKISNALQHVHDREIIHNDLKSNNVVLGKDDDQQFLNPVIIDFGKSVLASKAKKPKAKALCVSTQYENSYIAPELVNGTGKPSVATDVFALCFMVRSLYSILQFEIPAVVQNGLDPSPENRPSITDIGKSFQ